MSAKATGWVWEHCPFPDPTRLCILLAIADVVNDRHNNEFYMSMANLAEKAHVSRATAVRTMKELVETGIVEVVESGKTSGRPTIYAFLGGVALGESPSEGVDHARVAHMRARGGSPGESGVDHSYEPPQTQLNPIEPKTLAAPKKIDELWDAVMDACNVADVPRSARGKYNVAVRDLRELGVTPQEVYVRAKRFTQLWPEASLTPNALSVHWGELEPPKQASPGFDDEAFNKTQEMLTKFREEAQAATAPPWIREGVTREEWLANGA